ncbi:DUF1127 domain-containing protein [Bradyrhizobium sp. SSUT18]|nr:MULTISPECIES: DUF1127 domain-containing protein [unclassified Bradyrhizobium]MDH2343773.1 DUF1127 domain-containing protein [Bradyrhizobium sp. SSUT77]MDH2355107.1 DUF1127 domain-containing protein [Bradyrhizobium sp. SSUT112]MDH2404003.1 DUF1127 domain-containing protein [Bradyrhizobium sp. SSUT18]
MRARRDRSRARLQLAAMTERELQDFGMSRSEIAYELHKPAGENRERWGRGTLPRLRWKWSRTRSAN